jgi:hypothetical protein
MATKADKAAKNEMKYDTAEFQNPNTDSATLYLHAKMN